MINQAHITVIRWICLKCAFDHNNKYVCKCRFVPCFSFLLFLCGFCSVHSRCFFLSLFPCPFPSSDTLSPSLSLCGFPFPLNLILLSPLVLLHHHCEMRWDETAVDYITRLVEVVCFKMYCDSWATDRWQQNKDFIIWHVVWFGPGQTKSEM